MTIRTLESSQRMAADTGTPRSHDREAQAEAAKQKAAMDLYENNQPMWKQVGSLAMSSIPGGFALSYANGSDLFTGRKIEKGNWLNIMGAAFSVLPAVGIFKTGRNALRGAELTKGVVKGMNGVDDASASAAMIENLTTTLQTPRIGTFKLAQVVKESENKIADVTSMALRTAHYYNTGNKAVDVVRKARAFVPFARSLGRGGEAYKVASGMQIAEKSASQLAKSMAALSDVQIVDLARRVSVVNSAKVKLNSVAT